MSGNLLKGLPSELLSLPHLAFVKFADNRAGRPKGWPLVYGTSINPLTSSPVPALTVSNMPEDGRQTVWLEAAFQKQKRARRPSKDAESDSVVRGAGDGTQGWAEMQGRRPTQEDAVVLLPPGHFRAGSQREAFYAVFDGHGGNRAAQFCAEHMPEIFRVLVDHAATPVGDAPSDPPTPTSSARRTSKSSSEDEDGPRRGRRPDRAFTASDEFEPPADEPPKERGGRVSPRHRSRHSHGARTRSDDAPRLDASGGAAPAPRKGRRPNLASSAGVARTQSDADLQFATATVGKTTATMPVRSNPNALVTAPVAWHKRGVSVMREAANAALYSMCARGRERGSGLFWADACGAAEDASDTTAATSMVDYGEVFVESFRHAHREIEARGIADGAAAVCAYVVGQLCVMANAGDSRAVLFNVDGSVRAATQDHKPQSLREVERIRSVNGFVTENGRVCGTLGLARAIGDSPFQPMVTHAPDVVLAPLRARPCCLVLACDGVWDVVDQTRAWFALRTWRA